MPQSDRHDRPADVASSKAERPARAKNARREPKKFQNRAAAARAPVAEPCDVGSLFDKGFERFSQTEKEWIVKAYLLAKEAHGATKRVSGGPYLSHPVAVAKTLIEMGLDWATVCAGLLHDTVEDTHLTLEDLQKEFPEPVADLVEGVTKISSLNFQSSREEQLENFRKMLLAMARDIRVIMIKLADRLHNLETLKYLPVAKQRRIAQSSMEIYAPLAHRLGIYRIKSAIEDRAMRYLYPEAYREMRERVAAKRVDREGQIQESIVFLRERLRENGIEAEVTGRSKHFWSIFQKMRAQKLSFEEIFDLNALRVICSTRAECYEILGIIHSVWRPVPEHFADYIAMPKANLYQSIHTKVIGLNGQLTEIQVRTRDMHRVAEEGIAAHWQYKEGRKGAGEFDKKLVWVRQMVDWLTDSNDPGELLHDLRREVFDDKVFCFTPRGDVIEMSRGATVLDFAYRIHTDLGHRCVGGKINQRFVPLRAELKMGDLVEIQASKTPHPSPDWLKIAKSPRARAKIRHWLKLRDFDKNVTAGREMLAKALSRANVRLGTQEIQNVLEKHLGAFHARSVEELFSEIGFGTIPTSMVLARFLPEPTEPKRRAKQPKKKTETSPVRVEGVPGALTRFAQCCKPQPGEPISGLVTRGRGISIHLSDCPHFRRWITDSADFASRLVPVSWTSEGSERKQLGFRVTARDRTGILRDITNAVAGMDIMIVASFSRSDMRMGQAILRFTVLVKNEDELTDLMQRLREIPDVRSVVRDSKFR